MNVDGGCARGTLKGNLFVWSKANCADPINGFICEIPHSQNGKIGCYAQPIEEDTNPETKDSLEECKNACEEKFYTYSQTQSCQCLGVRPLGGENAVLSIMFFLLIFFCRM